MNSPDQVPSKSYAAVVNKRLSLKKFDYEVSMLDSFPTIEVSSEVIKNSIPLCENFLMGRLPNTAPHVIKIHVIVNKICTLGNKSIKIYIFEIYSMQSSFESVTPQPG